MSGPRLIRMRPKLFPSASVWREASFVAEPMTRRMSPDHEPVFEIGAELGVQQASLSWALIHGHEPHPTRTGIVC